MQRDLDLIREILLTVEASGPSDYIYEHHIADHEHNIVCAHMELLIEGGYAVGNPDHDAAGGYVGAYIARLTMEGHDYLDSVRDPQIYRETKSRLEKVGGAASLAVVKEVAKTVVINALGIG